MMAQFGPLMITAHNQQQAEYLVRSRAEQRGVSLTEIHASDGTGGMWHVTGVVADADAGKAAGLADETKVLHINLPQPKD
jgi:hypothetical protein